MDFAGKEGIRCPYCAYRFKLLAMNGTPPDLAPFVCESCAEVGLVERGVFRKVTEEELGYIKQSPAWRDVLEPAIALIRKEQEKRS